MKISVIIPTYNRASFLEKTLQSILEQSVNVDEIIVIDDGSTDETEDILKSYPVNYFYQSNQGVSAARNLGLLKAKNSWIAFLDSDDIWHPKKIEQHINFHKANPLILSSYSDELWVRNNIEIKLKTHQQKEIPTFLNSLRLCKIGPSTFFCHKEIFETVGNFDENLVVSEDYDLWLRILQKYEIGYIDEKLTTKYAGHDQLSFSTKLSDVYRIEALKKHIHSAYKNEVIKELIYKTSLLLKGAIKHNNQEVIEKYQEELNYFLSQK